MPARTSRGDGDGATDGAPPSAAGSPDPGRGPDSVLGMGDWRADLVRASFDAFAASDPDALVPLYDPECVWDAGVAGASYVVPAGERS